jgi:hypothetical protein
MDLGEAFGTGKAQQGDAETDEFAIDGCEFEVHRHFIAEFGRDGQDHRAVIGRETALQVTDRLVAPDRVKRGVVPAHFIDRGNEAGLFARSAGKGDGASELVRSCIGRRKAVFPDHCQNERAAGRNGLGKRTDQRDDRRIDNGELLFGKGTIAPDPVGKVHGRAKVGRA